MTVCEDSLLVQSFSENDTRHSGKDDDAAGTMMKIDASIGNASSLVIVSHVCGLRLFHRGSEQEQDRV